jgi:hypothetical protein
MPIIPHDTCTEPPGDTRICRFIDLPKFRDLFANEELYFRRTDLFKETDPNEALPSDEYARRVLRLERYDLHDELALNNDLAFARHKLLAAFRRRNARHVEDLRQWRCDLFPIRAAEISARTHAGQHFGGHGSIRRERHDGLQLTLLLGLNFFAPKFISPARESF